MRAEVTLALVSYDCCEGRFTPYVEGRQCSVTKPIFTGGGAVCGEVGRNIVMNPRAFS